MVSRDPIINWILVACLLLTSCRSFASDSPTPDLAAESTSLPDTPTPEPDYVNQLRNSEYQLGATDGLRIVQLTDGRFDAGVEGGDEFVSVVAVGVAKGSINGSGDNEYAMLVSENYGGSGSFMFLAVYADVGGAPKFLTSRLVDDRPNINELSFEDTNLIFLDGLIHSADDRMCCPTLRTTRHYRLSKLGSLVMTDYTTFTPDDRPRMINIESPVNGTEVFGSVHIKGSITVAPFENNLVYRIIDVGGVELAIGSITITAPELGGSGTFDEEIALGNVLSGALIRLDVQDVNAEDGSLFAMDSVDLVVK